MKFILIFFVYESGPSSCRFAPNSRRVKSRGGTFSFYCYFVWKITVLLFCLEKNNSSNNRHVLFFLPTGSQEVLKNRKFSRIFLSKKKTFTRVPPCHRRIRTKLGYNMQIHSYIHTHKCVCIYVFLFRVEGLGLQQDIHSWRYMR